MLVIEELDCRLGGFLGFVGLGHCSGALVVPAFSRVWDVGYILNWCLVYFFLKDVMEDVLIKCN